MHVQNGKRDNKCECSYATRSNKLNSLTEKIQAKTEAKTQAKNAGEKGRRKTQAKKAGEKRRRTPQRKPAAKISNVVYSAEREWFKISPQVFSSAKCAGYEAPREQSGQPGENIKGHQGCQKQGYSTFGKSRAD